MNCYCSEQIVPCEACRYCERGQYHVCAPHDIYGFHRATPGAMAQFMLYPARSRTHRVPAGLPARAAVFIEPLACSVHAVRRAEIRPDDVVVVAGNLKIDIMTFQRCAMLNVAISFFFFFFFEKNKVVVHLVLE